MLKNGKKWQDFKAIERLDCVLAILYNYDIAYAGIALTEIGKKISAKKDGMFLSDLEVLVVVEKLIKDGYAQGTRQAFALTFDGRFIHETGGYNQKDYDTKRNHMYQNNLESEIRLNSKRQVNLQHTVAILTTFVAAGTIISGIYYLLEILKIFRPRWFGI
jgi:hypothetical protein